MWLIVLVISWSIYEPKLVLVHGIDVTDPQYMGCYRKSDAMIVYRGNLGSVTACVESCGNYDTWGFHFTYAGLQSGTCYCGDSYGTLAASLFCYNHQMVRCSSEKTNGCGATDTISVYKVCPPGWRGDTCQYPCTNCAVTRECRKWDGACLGCTPGWTGTECGDACKKGKYGFNCATNCPSGCRNSNCDRKLGYCLDGCESGNGPFCSSCPSTAQNPSGPSCPFCDHCLNSECVGNGTECYYKCPSNWQGDKCKACVRTRWGDKCQYACGTTTANCVYCDRETGVCEQCSSGYYGVTCIQCSQNCLNDDCEMDTGACYGCKPGFYGAQCEKKCPMNCGIPTCDGLSGRCENCRDGFYGETCANECGQCLEGRCDFVTGHCTSCKNGYYGNRCNKTCPGYCTHFACDKVDGTCTSCEAGYYGQCCISLCGHCLSGSCDFESGECDPCLPGYFGVTCDQTCPEYCTNSTCNKLNGTCASCKDGYFGNYCNKICRNCVAKRCDQNNGHCGTCLGGYYGDGCNLRCPQNCNGSCDKTSRNCDSCKDGYHGSQCESSCGACQSDTCKQTDGACSLCKPGFFGAKCQARCSGFCVSESCDQTIGNCGDGGCKTGHYGLKCDKLCPMFCGGNGCQQLDGACIGCQRNYYGEHCDRKCLALCDGCFQENGTCTSCPQGQYDNNCSSKCHCKDRGACDKDSGECPDGCDESYTGMTCSEPIGADATAVTIAAASSSAGLVVLIVIVVVVVVVVCKKRRKKSHAQEETAPDPIAALYATPHARTPVQCHNQKSDTVDVGDILIKEKSEYIDLDVNPTKEKEPNKAAQNGKLNGSDWISKSAATDVKTTPIDIPAKQDGTVAVKDNHVFDTTDENPYENTSFMKLADLRKYIINATKDGLFEKEFKSIRNEPVSPCTIAQQPSVKCKNRYKNIVPYDKNRVVLSEIDSDPHSDYINASYLPGYKHENKFIGAQGATVENIIDFWRMICEKNISTIVMLTNVREVEKVKCIQYWPRKGSKEYGKITVTLTSFQRRGDIVIRKFKAEMAGESVCIDQYQYQGWPDHGVPDTPVTLVNLLHRVRDRTAGSEAPTLVHCSAGVGRTGTFVALDNLLCQAEAEGVVDVAGCVARLRDYRVNMVQTVHQYEFLYHAVYHGATVGRSLVPVTDFPLYVSQLTADGGSKLKRQFQYIDDLVHDRDMFAPASHHGNPPRDATDIMMDMHLTFCLRPQPQQDSLYDFWQRLKQRNVAVMVDMTNGKTDKFWLPSPDAPLLLSGIKVTTTSPASGQHQDIVIEDEASSAYYNLEKTDSPTEYMNFGETDKPPSAPTPQQYKMTYLSLPNLDSECIMSVHNALQRLKPTGGHSSLTVALINNNLFPAGVFLAASILLEKAELTQELDVLDAVCVLREQNRQLCSTLEHFKHLYKVVADTFKQE